MSDPANVSREAVLAWLDAHADDWAMGDDIKRHAARWESLREAAFIVRALPPGPAPMGREDLEDVVFQALRPTIGALEASSVAMKVTTTILAKWGAR